MSSGSLCILPVYELEQNRADRAQVQAALNAWAKESARPLCQLSLILAASVED